jgi:ABC-2 type transport system permease protein
MKRLDFKKEIKIRWMIVSSCTMFGFRESLAYSLNNWGNLLSMVIYMITYLIFLDVLFGRVKMVAGYDYAEMLFFTLIIQINFYLLFVISQANVEKLDESINTGELDLWLVRPVPALWFVSFRKINLGELLFSAFPATIPLLVILSGKWSELNIQFGGVVSGILCIILGQIIIHCYVFLIAMTAFFTGEGKHAKGMSVELVMFGDTIPFEGFPKFMKYIGFTIVPFLVQTALAVSFFLGKSTNYYYLIYIFGLAVFFLWLKTVAWRFALRHYSSASS